MYVSCLHKLVSYMSYFLIYCNLDKVMVIWESTHFAIQFYPHTKELENNRYLSMLFTEVGRHYILGLMNSAAVHALKMKMVSLHHFSVTSDTGNLQKTCPKFAWKFSYISIGWELCYGRFVLLVMISRLKANSHALNLMDMFRLQSKFVALTWNHMLIWCMLVYV